MRKLFTIAALLAVMPVFAEHVDPDTARKAAATFLNNNGAKSTQLDDLSKTVGIPNLYVFNGESCFVVMSADDCAIPVLGYSLTEEFDAENMPESLAWWLQGYGNEIQYAIDHQLKAPSETVQQWKDLTEGKTHAAKAKVVVTLPTTTQWGQGNPYNNLCPSSNNGQAITGCVATAMAQVMKYWEYPNRGIGYHSYQYSSYGTIAADFGASDYDWDNMTDTYSSTSTAAQQEAVATLMYHCGVSVEMQYGPDESASNIKRSSYGMKTYFNYNTSYIEKKNYTDDEWAGILINELDEGRPMLYGGSGEKGGHAFVCDGYNSDGKFHFNWGWNGSHNNDYFGLSSLTPGSYNFSSEQSAVIGIYPLTQKITPIALSNSQNTLTWTDSQSCSAYNVYRNDALIATTTSTTFTDPDPAYGVNKYYVRGLKDDVLSQPSNYASFTVNYPIPTASNFHAELNGNNLSFSWEAPDWCFPATADEETFAYVDEERQTNNDSHFYFGEGNYVLSWGSRYPANILTDYHGKAIFEISFFSMEPGAFDVVVYQGTEDGKPVDEIARESITTARIGWSKVSFDTPIIIDNSKDLWIFVSSTDCKIHTLYNKFVSGNIEGCYYAGDDPTLTCYHNTSYEAVWLIRPYLTDATYTYNLYRDGVKIANNLSGTTGNATLTNNAPNQFTVATNYYGGEAKSNMLGYAKGTASVTSLDLSTGDKMTVTDGSILTVTNDLTSTNPANLIIENGARLISNSENVEATTKRNIETFTGNSDKGHWYLIASPMTDEFPVGETNLTSTTTNNYDLYIFDQNEEGREWRNYKNGRFTHIKNTVGYLYASAENTCVTFAGTLNNTDGEVHLVYSDYEKTFRGYNLIGNPFPCNASIGNRSFYRIVENNGVSELQPVNSGMVYPMEGIIVQAQNANDNTVTFIKETPSTVANGNNSESITMDISQGQGVIDRAIVRFDKEGALGKLMLNPENTQLYIPQGGKDYAIATSNKQGEMPINFKAQEDGTYTLTVSETANCQLPTVNYLHLIDNITGADIDLLATPSYSFEAKASDYTSRFRLMFNPIDEVPTNNSLTEGDMQIFDVTGRFVGNNPTKLTPGVYILQTIHGNEIKTEKIIIK